MEYTINELAKYVEKAGLTAWTAVLNPETGKYRLYEGDEELEAVRLDLFATRSQFQAALAMGLKIPRHKLKEIAK